MLYPQNYPQPQYKEDPRMTKLRQHNMQLEKALKELNECYQQKIQLLKQELKKSKQRQELLLEWKSNYIDKELFNNAKYEQQLQRMVKMMQEMAQNYEKENLSYRNQLEQKQELISQLKNQNTYLKQQTKIQQEKIQSLAQKYILEIQRLNSQLKELKDEINYEEPECSEVQCQPCFMEGYSSNQEANDFETSIYEKNFRQNEHLEDGVENSCVLRDISSQQNIQSSSQRWTGQKSSAGQNIAPSLMQLIL